MSENPYTSMVVEDPEWAPPKIRNLGVGFVLEDEAGTGHVGF